MATSTRNDCKEAYENVSSRWIVDACHQDSSRIGQCEEQVLVEVYPWEKAGEYGSTVILMCCIYVYAVLTDTQFPLISFLSLAHGTFLLIPYSIILYTYDA